MASQAEKRPRALKLHFLQLGARGGKSRRGERMEGVRNLWIRGRE